MDQSKVKKAKRNIIACALAVSMVTSLIPLNAISVHAAQEYSTGVTDYGFMYRVNGGGESVTITGHQEGTSLSGEVVIPSSVTVDGEVLPVTIVNGFTDYKNITSVRFPDTITVLSGFARCASLAGEIVIPKSVTQIYTSSFQSCTSIEKIIFEEGSQLVSIGGGSFYGCTNLSGDLILPDGLKSVSSNTFSGNTIFANCAFDGTLKVSETMTSNIVITGNRFEKIINNSDVTISVFSGVDFNVYCYRNEQGEEAASIGKGTFNLSYKNGVKKIGEYTVKISDNDAAILAYDGEGTGKDLVVPSTIKDGSKVLNVTRIGDYVYTGKNFNGKLTIPSGITSIGAYAFSEMSGLTGDINIPDTVTSIGGRAFYRCKGFDGKLKLSSNLEYIGASAFMSCSNLTGDLYIPDSVTEMAAWAFGGCSNMKGILHISSGLTSIADYSLSEIGCSGDLIIPEGVTTIGTCAFRWDSGFDGELSLPDSLETVSSGAFSYSRFCGELTLPKNLQSFSGDFCYSFFTKVINESETTFSTSRFYFSSSVRYILSGDENETTVNQFEPEKTYDARWNVGDGEISIKGTFFRATGSEVKPDITVTVMNNTLKKGTDYDVEYSNNILPGTATVTVTGKGVYEGENSIDFTIAKEDAVNIEDDEKFTVDVAECTYNGQVQTPSIIVKYDGDVLEEDKDYTIEGYSDNIHAYDSPKVTIKGTDDKYSGVYKKSFEIQPLDINDKSVTVSEVEDVNYFNYYGTRARGYKVTFNGVSLSFSTKGYEYGIKSGCYVGYENTGEISTDTSKAAVVFEGFGDFTGVRRAYYNILKLNLADENVTINVDPQEVEFVGEAIEPKVTISYKSGGGSVNIDKSNINIEFANNTNAGKATISLEGIEKCEGSVTKEFTIKPVDITSNENVVINDINSLVYSKKALTPEVIITFKNKQLELNKDFSVAYDNNITPGEAKVTVTGKGNFTGEKELTFDIEKADVANAVVTGIAGTYVDEEAQIKPVPKSVTLDGNALVEGTDYDIEYGENINVGPATVRIVGKGNYSGEKIINFNITKKYAADISQDGVAIISGIAAGGYDYIGKAVEPEFELTVAGEKLVVDKDYTVEYENNVTVGTAVIIIKGSNDYTGTKTVEFKINSLDLSKAVVADTASVKYTGKEITPQLEVGYKINGNDTVLVKDKDYTVSFEKNINAGEAVYTVTAVEGSNFKGSKTGTFTIEPCYITADNFTVSCDKNIAYTGEVAVPDVTVTMATDAGNYMLIKDKDFTINATESINVGKYSMTITAKNNFAGTIDKEYEIVVFGSRPDVNDEKFEIGLSNDLFVKKEAYGSIKPDVSVSYNGNNLVEGIDYIADFENDGNLGDAIVSITGINKYSGKITKRYKIIPADISKYVTAGISDKTYTGKAISQSITLSFESVTLKPGTDYKVTYANNVNAGTATVKITGAGQFEGYINETFKINPITISSKNTKVSSVTAKTFTGKNLTQNPVVKYNGSTILKNGTDYTVQYKNNKNAGTATLVITGKGNYKGSVNVNFKINAKKIVPAVTLKATSFVYTGKAITPAVTVKYGKTVLKKGTDYTVTYAVGRKNVGRYKVTVKLKGNYSGNKTVTFDIKPKGTSIKKLTKASKAITAKWTAITAKMATSVINGYQIQLATNAKFTSGKKTVNVAGAKVSLKKITKLAGNKKYYVRIRTYKKVGKITFYSNWSKTVNAKTAK